MTKHQSKHKEKFCNICGESVLEYSVIDNAPLCEECVPVKKQIPVKSERDMVLKIIGGEKK